MSLFRYLLRRSRRLVALAALAGAVSGFAGAGVIALLERAMAGEASAGATLAWAFVAVAGVTVLSRVLSQILLTQLGQTTIAEVRMELSRRILEAPLRRIEELGGHRLLAALNDDATVVTEAFVYLPLVCVNAATVVGCLVYLGFVSWAVLAVVVAAMIIGTAVFRAHQRRALRHFVRSRETSDALHQHFRTLTAGIKELKMNRQRAEAFLSDVLGRSVESYRRELVLGMTVYSAAMGWGALLFYLVLGATVFALPAWAGLSSGGVSGATLALFYLMGPFAQVVDVLPAVGRAGVAFNKWKELGLALAQDGSRSHGHPRLPGPETSLSTWKRLELVDVTHRYFREREDESFRLGPVNLTFRPGELVFLVGGNGSGKTTLALLLLGLYAPESGEIRLDGVPVEEASRERYRQLFSVVFADLHLSDDLLALPDRDATERARRYLQRLELDHRVRIEDGRLRVDGLSQGQRKRLALVLASLDDRPFYVFDEWASDQDPQFRRIFYTELLPELRARGKTALVITHDDQYFQSADRCLRMDFGVVTESSQAPLPLATGTSPHMRSAR